MKRITLTDFEASELLDALELVLADLMESEYEEEEDQRSAEVRLATLEAVAEAIHDAEETPAPPLSDGEMAALTREVKRRLQAKASVSTAADVADFRSLMIEATSPSRWQWRVGQGVYARAGTVLAETPDGALAEIVDAKLWPPIDTDAERLAIAEGRWLQLYDAAGNVVRRRGNTPLAN